MCLQITLPILKIKPSSAPAEEGLILYNRIRSSAWGGEPLADARMLVLEVLLDVLEFDELIHDRIDRQTTWTVDL